MSNQSPHVNVVIANYNYEKWICNAIDSALNQTYSNISITIVDDMSTDNSWSVLHKKYFKSNPHERISYGNYESKFVKLTGKNKNDITLTAIRLDKNSGPSKARNVGIEYSINTADAFMILDADDEMKPNKVARMLQELLASPVIAVVYGDYDIFNLENGLCIREYKESFSIRRLLGSCIVHSNALIRKQALLDVKDSNGFYDERIKGPEDYDLWLRISSKYMIMHIPESLSKVRITGSNISGQSHPEFSENFKNGFNIIRSKRYFQ